MDEDAASYSGEIAKIERQTEHLFKQFKSVLDTGYAAESGKHESVDVNESLSKAVSLAESENELIQISPPLGLAMVKANKQETGMLFIILLLLSQDCVKTVSDKTIQCEVKENEDHILIDMSHMGHIEKDKYVDILFNHEPIETFLLKCRPTNFLDTLLCYASLLVKKNDTYRVGLSRTCYN